MSRRKLTPCPTSSRACGAPARTTGFARWWSRWAAAGSGWPGCQEIREADRRLPRVGQAQRGLVRVLRRVHPGQRALLPGHRVRPDLPAAFRDTRADRRGRRAGVPARRAGQVGVAFQVAKRHEFKCAADNLTERGFSGPAREATERLAVSIAEQVSAAIAERRGKTLADARALLDRGPVPGRRRARRGPGRRSSATVTRCTRTCASGGA